MMIVISSDINALVSITLTDQYMLMVHAEYDGP